MSQHFLQSAKARGLSVAKVARMSDEEAYAAFKAIRWAETNGEPVCPKCGCVASYEIKTRQKFKCAGCLSQYSVTSGTIFASRKLAIKDILVAIAIFINSAKGHSALQLSRDLDVQYKTAFVLSHKIREALGSTLTSDLTGEVEVDGAYFGGHVRPKNRREEREDRRTVMAKEGKRQVVTIMRERRGRALPYVCRSEAAGTQAVEANVLPGAVVHADEAPAYNRLHARFQMRRINHKEAYSDGVACTNQAESYFARMRRSEIGVHHHFAGPYLQAYANEMAWRENHRRVANGDQFIICVAASLGHPVSKAWKGYWQRSG